VRDAGCLMHPQPRVQKKRAVGTRVFTAEAPENPAIPHAMVYNLYRALLGEVLIAPVVLQKMACQARLGRRTSAGLDPSVRGGTTRLRCPLQHRSSCATSVSSQAHLNGHLPCQRPITPDTAASIASHPASVTIAIRPLLGTRRRHYALFRTKREQKYFSRRGSTGAKHQATSSSPRSRGSRTPRGRSVQSLPPPEYGIPAFAGMTAGVRHRGRACPAAAAPGKLVSGGRLRL